MNLSQNIRIFNHRLTQINIGKQIIFSQREACAMRSIANRATKRPNSGIERGCAPYQSHLLCRVEKIKEGA